MKVSYSIEEIQLNIQKAKKDRRDADKRLTFWRSKLKKHQKEAKKHG